ncbi:ATP-binding protein [Nibrella saemangeumensis]|uniref:histidine kinase n=1 Tax=Nibrella saemangeumensis TaxID=1084526 RepID=A0ABP8N2X1_9BACT
MTIKTKLFLGLIFLFSIILLLTGLGAFYLNQLAGDSQAILENNYLSLQYTSTMQKALSALGTDPDALKTFEQSLQKQEQNITEEGEQELIEALSRDFDRLKTGAVDSLTRSRIRGTVLQLDDINRQAMFRKNNTARQTAREALLWLAAVGTLCFGLVLSFILYFPGYIANPLRELTQSIKQIASRNFEERLHFHSDDEFGELARSFNSMAQKLDEYEHSSLAQLLFEKKRIDTLIQLMPDGIIGLDEHKRVLFANPVACRLLSMTETDLVGTYAPDVASVNDVARTLIQDLMNNTPATGESRLLKIPDQGKESYFRKQTHQVTVTCTGEEKPIPAGYVIVLANVTPYQERDQARTNFIATVSHELKTPISGIKLSLKLLEDDRIGPLNEEQTQLVDLLRDDADRLLHITGELLNMAQVESGQIELRLENVSAIDIIEVATSAVRVPAEQKNIHLEVHIPAGLPLVKADPDKASWVLINFLSNAVRHSLDNSPIRISARQTNNTVEFCVRDYGTGIRPEDRDRLFDPYFRGAVNLHADKSSPVSGTGLGLSISREFITSMHGEIGILPDISDGAAFYFRLPVA